ncbi:MAG: IclR family transcriptional regulator [Alphaproteobacteria bacterium]|nr:IclR family transcriptional regulator [Alphaproteobacteria bacterium]MBN9498543.1 IclR family transcriptional regulator [Alphaproteobacteria bacterium]
MRAVSRILAILRALGPRTPQLSLTEIAERAHLDLGTTRRMLAALAAEGMIARDPHTKLYRLDLGLLELAGGVVEYDDLRAQAQAAVDAVARETGATSFFGVYRDGEALCFARAEGAAIVLLRWWTLGGRMPLNCGAAPRTLLAHQSQSEIDRVLAGPMIGLTPRSEKSPARLRRELVAIRRQGYAHAVDDVVLGVAGLAVPVLDRKGKLRGALAIAGLTPHFASSARKELLATLRRHAEAMRKRA